MLGRVPRQPLTFPTTIAPAGPQGYPVHLSSLGLVSGQP